MDKSDLLEAQQVRREFRYERKFFIDQLTQQEALALTKRHPAMFSEIYPPRYINNIYFDYPLLENYTDNIDGASQRKKARVRWYHDLFGVAEEPTLEFKIKEGMMGTKISYPFPDFSFQNGFSESALRDTIRGSTLPLEVRQYLETVEPVLANRYRRWYLATPDQAFRITVDAELTYYHLNKFNNQFLFHQVDRRSIIVELKYTEENDPRADQISAGFPFRMTRSSKYVQGIERVYL
jgi:SPX domain protein involved in polyphosphate accumulation